MGRIHRIGQTRDVHIYNLVAMNTREGAVLATLLRKLENMAETLGESVFDVIGEIFAGTRLAELIEKVLAGEVTEQQAIEELGGDAIDPSPGLAGTSRLGGSSSGAAPSPRLYREVLQGRSGLPRRRSHREAR